MRAGVSMTVEHGVVKPRFGNDKPCKTFDGRCFD